MVNSLGEILLLLVSISMCFTKNLRSFSRITILQKAKVDRPALVAIALSVEPVFQADQARARPLY